MRCDRRCPPHGLGAVDSGRPHVAVDRPRLRPTTTRPPRLSWGFWHSAQGWFWPNDMAVDEVLTDNGANFVSDAFAEVLTRDREDRHCLPALERPPAH